MYPIYESGSSLVQRVTSLRFFAAGPLQPDGFSAAAAIRACEHAGQWPLALALLQGTVKRWNFSHGGNAGNRGEIYPAW